MMSGIITNPPVPRAPAPGCHGGHVLRPQQERAPDPGAGGLFHSGPAEGDEEDHLHRPVTSSHTSAVTNLSSRRPARPFLLIWSSETDSESRNR